MKLTRVEIPFRHPTEGWSGVEEKWVLVFESEEEAKQAKEIIEREKDK